jgi:16S rRNA (uracil1498-N3)-methyltransferase
MTHIHRFFLSRQVTTGDMSVLDEDDAFHAEKVLRLGEGDSIEVADAAGKVFGARISSVGGEVRFIAGDLIMDNTASRILTVAQALPRGKKMDLVVEKLSELGVDILVPVESKKSVARPEREGEKVKRWRRIARASAAQAKRSTVMEVTAPVAMLDWIGDISGSLVVLSTEVEAEKLGTILRSVEPPLTLVVGPESGFDPVELEALGEHGARFGMLGRQILRTETAALVASAIVLHHMGEIG